MTFISLVSVVFIAIFGSVSSVPIYEQCFSLDGGRIFNKCDDGLVCYAQSMYYANCRRPNTCPSGWACTIVQDASTIISPPRTIPANEQCDNSSYTVCTAGTACFQRTSGYSECRSQCPATWQCENAVAQAFEQCGGEGYIGTTRCAPGLRCFNRSKWYAQCAASCPGADWSC